MCGFLVLGFIAATLSLPAAVFPILAVLAVVMLAVIVVPHTRFVRYNKQVLEVLRAYRPVLTMPYDGQAGFHIGLWLPYLERTGHPFTVVTTDAVAFRRVSEMYTMPVIYAPKRGRRAIRAMLPKTVRAALYVYNGNNRRVHQGPPCEAHLAPPWRQRQGGLLPAEVSGIRHPRRGWPCGDRPLRRTWGPHSVDEVQDSWSSPD